MFLRLIIGPMFSGKTTHLVGHYNRLLASRIKSNQILVVNHCIDNRYSTKFLATHNDVTDIECEMIPTLMTITKNKIEDNNYKAILINEGQFFQDILYWIKYISKHKLDIEIIVSGLDADYKQEPFGDFLNIIPYCREVEKLTSICTMCNLNKAEYTIRTSDDKEQILVGNHNIYQPVCSDCYC